MRRFTEKFSQKVRENQVAQPIVFCPRCLVLLTPSKKVTKGRVILHYEHRHKPLWIYLMRSKDGRKKYRCPINRKTPLRDILRFARMGWKLYDWSILQVAHYINICLKARREGKEIDALAVLFVDSVEPSENEKDEILKALGLRG